MAELERQPAKRQVAFKVRIKDILNSNYVKEDGWQPNYLDINGNKISRVNIIGIVVLKNNNDSVIIDDGTGKVQLRVFENNKSLENVDIGNAILMIGRPREFNSEKYIMPEIVKKIEDPKWIEIRKKELKIYDKVIPNNVIESSQEKKDIVVEEVDVTPSEKVFNNIKKMDTGEGVIIEDVINNSNIENCEEIIKKLLENGEIFEVKPGKIKVLE